MVQATTLGWSASTNGASAHDRDVYDPHLEVLRELVRKAKTQVPFYTDHLASVKTVNSVEDLPIIDHTKYWSAAEHDGRLVSTGAHLDGIVMASGGTTARPKITRYSQVDFQRFAQMASMGLLRAGLQSGDRIANMLNVGNLYPSFLTFVLSTLALPVPAVQIPIAGHVVTKDMVDQILRNNATVLLSTITTLVALAQHCLPRGIRFPMVRRIMYGGERLFKDQERVLRQLCPNSQLRSVIFVSADAGVIGFDATTEKGEQRVQFYSPAVIMELVTEDDSRQVIRENGVPGTIIVTSLIRELCPVLRYPLGDRAEWIDREAGIFRLLGRTSIAVRLGPLSIDIEDLRRIVCDSVPLPAELFATQAVIHRRLSKDQLELVIAAHGHDVEHAHLAIRALLETERPMFVEYMAKGYLAPLLVRFTNVSDMHRAPDSGKLLDVVDLRYKEGPNSIPGGDYGGVLGK